MLTSTQNNDKNKLGSFLSNSKAPYRKEYNKDNYNKDYRKNNYKNNNRKGYRKDAFNNPYKYRSVLYTSKVDQVVRGGRNSSFVAISVVGNGINKVGVAYAKAKTVNEAISNSRTKAAKNVIIIQDFKSIKYKDGATECLIIKKQNDILKSAYYLRPFFKAAGLNNITCKIIRSKNIVNMIFGIFNALKKESTKNYNMIKLQRIIKEDKEELS